jgi:hypothetical protein
MWSATPVPRSRRSLGAAFLSVRNFVKPWFIAALFVLVLFGAVWESRRLNAARDPSARIAVDARLEAPSPIVAIFNKSCVDCHSEQTRWPWYARVPPVSWLVNHDVSHARRAMNLSRLVSGPGGPTGAVGALSAICKMIQEQHMPPLRYRLMHPGSGLSGGDKAALCGWAASESSRLQQSAHLRAATRN